MTGLVQLIPLRFVAFLTVSSVLADYSHDKPALFDCAVLLLHVAVSAQIICIANNLFLLNDGPAMATNTAVHCAYVASSGNL